MSSSIFKTEDGDTGTHHTVICGDSRSMTEIPDSSVRLIVTSPPYWNLKDYGVPNQIGFGQDYEEYIADLNKVWTECYRVLHPGCRMCINVGDVFTKVKEFGRYKVIPIREPIIRFCETIGFDYMGGIIWHKITSSHARCGGFHLGSYPHPRNGLLKINYEFILILKKPGKAPKLTMDQKVASRLTNEEWKTFFNPQWQFPGVRQKGHPAMFPEELPRRLIKMFSAEGDTILDPFNGSGTTSRTARKLGRKSIGYEINNDFIIDIERKFGL